MNNSEFNHELRSKLVKKWAAATEATVEQVPRLPLDALLGEATDLVALLEKHFETKVIGGEKIGLDAVAAQSGVTAETAGEIWELVAAISEVKGRYVSEAKKSDDTLVRADEILSELRAVLSFLLEDGHHPEGAAQVAQLREEYDGAHSHDALALALEGFSHLASQNEAAITALGIVDAGIINEALKVADALRRRSADRLVGTVDDKREELMKLRNRLVAALQDRMNNARRTIRFVFRGHPGIVEKAGSRYFRDSKRKSRVKSSPDGITSSEVITGTEDTMEMKTPSAAQ